MMREQDLIHDCCESSAESAIFERELSTASEDGVSQANSIEGITQLAESIRAINRPLFSTQLAESIRAINRPLFSTQLAESIRAINRPLFSTQLAESISRHDPAVSLPRQLAASISRHQPAASTSVGRVHQPL